MYLAELLDLLVAKNAVFSESKSLSQFLARLGETWAEYERALNSINDPVSGDAVTHLSNAITEAQRILSECSLRDLFFEIEALKKNLQELLKEKEEEGCGICVSLDTLGDLLDRYAEEHARSDAISILMSAKDLHGKIEVYLQTNSDMLIRLASTEICAAEGESEFSILMASTNDYLDSIFRLLSLYDIYREICELLGISWIEHPLRIKKIESGSLLVRLFGEPGVFRFMADVVKAGAQYAYRNYTNEGQVSSIPKRIEVVEELLQLSDKLRDHGVDISDMNDQLQKAATALANQLNELISGQQSLRINDEEISAKTEQKKLLTGNTEGMELPGASHKRLNPSQDQ